MITAAAGIIGFLGGFAFSEYLRRKHAYGSSLTLQQLSDEFREHRDLLAAEPRGPDAATLPRAAERGDEPSEA